MLLKSYLSLFALVAKVLATSEEDFYWYGKGILMYYSCTDVMAYSATWCDADDYACSCHNPWAMATLAGCINYGNPPNGDEKEIWSYCAEYYAYTIDNATWYGAYENFTKNAVNVSADPDFNTTEVIDYPILLDLSLLGPELKSYEAFLGNYNDSLYYGAGILGYWALVFLLAIIFNWSKFLFPGFMKWCTGPISNFWRANVTLPALGGKHKDKEVTYLRFIKFLVPSRLESVVIFGFILVTTLVNAINYHWSEGDPEWPTRKEAMWRYSADRTGIVSVILMPLLILFAGRNNFLLWLTGWNYATFITYHRWLSRVTLVLVIVHSAVYTKDLIFYDELAMEYAETYLLWGGVGTVAGGVIWIQSFLYLRRNWYELFLLGHIIMAALFIAGTWIHVVTLGYVWFLYPSVALWSFDRGVRILRLLHFGFPKAEVSLLANETLKVVVRRPKFWPATPGGHAFVHFLRPSCFWQSHPFTFTSTVDAENIVVYCKVKGGVTHGLYQYLTAHPGKTAQIRVTFEGPYGEPTAARTSDTAVFIAGGNGIPGIYSECMDLATRAVGNSKKAVNLHWIIKDYNSLFWFYDEIAALKNTNVQCTVHVTRSAFHVEKTDDEVIEHDLDENVSTEQSEEVEKKSSSINFSTTENVDADIIHKIRVGLNHVTFLEGRPALDKLVKTEIEESSGSVAFVTCGNPVMVDEVRYYVAHSLHDSKGKRIDFYDQLQIWA
ncbi:ferric/cupric reductase transmembrane component 2 [[Candida] railenensis]|uniref:ferric-chelate reductase (NADPH) n=1 Tax=[Candida] railenensis TaxID=45579 RepID=A0A9P0VZC7_9ASCO|nr:ferric/cupric reductase transmembrane component 2 [[Candida] railenensis]